jgi:hypothetical protein
MYFGVFDFYLFLFLVIFVKGDFYKFLNLKKIFFFKKKEVFLYYKYKN